MAPSLSFLETKAHEKDGDSKLNRIITGAKTWIKHVNCETKFHSQNLP